MKNFFNYDLIKQNRLKLSKDGNFVSVHLSPFLIKNINYEKRKEFIKQVKHFLLVMTEQCKYFDIDLFHNNFSKMKFKFYDRKKKESGIIIFLSKKCKIYDMEAIIHELIHLATIRVDGSVEYCGFSINDYYYGDSFAKGLNEGYTQLIKERYFGNDSNIVYPFEVKYAKIIEFLIGKEKMEELFFSTNLKGLFKALEPYANSSKFRAFLNDLDHINNNFPPKNTTDNTYQQYFDQIHTFLFNCLKQKAELEPDNIEINDYLEQLFTNPTTYKYNNGKNEITVNYLSHEILDDYLNKKKR